MFNYKVLAWPTLTVLVHSTPSPCHQPFSRGMEGNYLCQLYMWFAAWGLSTGQSGSACTAGWAASARGSTGWHI